MSTKYKVTITPRLNDTDYGTEVDVSDRIELNGLGTITESIDGGDYDFGIFTYSDITMSGNNSDGFFNDVQDSRSMFPYARDLAKVTVTFFQEIDMETVTFRGIINEEATRVIAATDKIEFRVLSRDSIIKQSQIQTGVITDSMSFSEAFLRILNVDEIAKVLSIVPADIHPSFDGTIDDGSQFDNTNARDSLTQLLVASNSVLMVNDSNQISIVGRTENANSPLLLYGAGDLRGRENIINIEDYNTGLHRVFNTIKVNDSVESNGKHFFGKRERSFRPGIG